MIDHPALLQLLDEATDADARSADDAELRATAVALEQARCRLDATQAHVLAELDARGTTDRDLGLHTGAWLAREAHLPIGVARQRVRVGAKLRSLLPGTDAALARGDISWHHAATIAGVANPRIARDIADLEPELVDAARGVAFDRWRAEVTARADLLDQDGGHDPNRDLARNRLSVSSTFGGATHLSGLLTGEHGVVASAAIEAHADRLFRRYQADHERHPEVVIPTRATLRALAFAEICRLAGASRVSRAPAAAAASQAPADPSDGTNGCGSPESSGTPDSPDPLGSSGSPPSPDSPGSEGSSGPTDSSGSRDPSGSSGSAEAPDDSRDASGRRGSPDSFGSPDRPGSSGPTDSSGSPDVVGSPDVSGSPDWRGSSDSSDSPDRSGSSDSSDSADPPGLSGSSGSGRGPAPPDVPCSSSGSASDPRPTDRDTGADRSGGRSRPGAADARLPRPEVVLVIRAEHPDEVFTEAGVRLPGGLANPLLADPDLYALIVDSLGVPLSLGRRVRLATASQRRAIRIRDGGCVFPGCDLLLDHCDIHHVTRWDDGGTTDLPALAALCRHHHGVAHRQGWIMRATDDGWFWWQTPAGRTFWSQRHGRPREGPAPPPILIPPASGPLRARAERIARAGPFRC